MKEFHSIIRRQAAGWVARSYYKSTRLGAVLLGILLASFACVGYTPPGPDLPVRTSQRQSAKSPAASPSPRVSPSPARTPLPTLGVGDAGLQGTLVQFWYPRSADSKDLIRLLGMEFSRTNPWGIDVQVQVWDDYTSLVQGVTDSIYGDLPDLLLVYNYHAARLDASGKLLVDLAPYIYSSEWGFTLQELEDFYPPVWEQEVYASGGGSSVVLGVPFYRLAQLLLFNESWANEMGFLIPPSTPQRFRDLTCAAARFNQRDEHPQNDGTGGWVVDTDASTLTSWIYAYGGELAVPGDGYAFADAGTRRALAYLRDLYDSGCAWISPDPYPNAELADRRALFIASNVTGLASQEAAFARAGSSDHWTAIPFPSAVGEPVIDAYGPSLAVVRSTPAKQLAAWLFLKWLVQPEVQARWTERYGTLPTRASVGSLLTTYQKKHPQWAAALELLPFARSEPRRLSWEVVRWALSDAGKQLFSPTFTAGQLPDLLEMLASTATELDEQFR